MGDLNRVVEGSPREHVRLSPIEVENEIGWRTLPRLMLNLDDAAD